MNITNKKIESPLFKFNLDNFSLDKFLAIGPLYSFSMNEIYPKPAAPSSLAQSFNLSKKLLGLFSILLIIIPFTTLPFKIFFLGEHYE